MDYIVSSICILMPLKKIPRLPLTAIADELKHLVVRIDERNAVGTVLNTFLEKCRRPEAVGLIWNGSG